MEELVKAESSVIEQENAEIHRGKVLNITHSSPDIDIRGILNTICQYISLAEVMEKIEHSTEYVVQIPAEFMKAYQRGEYWIMESAKTGKQWPSLMKMGDDGKPQIVTPLPIKRRDFLDGDPVKEITDHYHNLYLQQQMNELSSQIESTLETVKRIENGQLDDRVGLLNAGRQGVILALSQKDEASRTLALQNAVNNINVAQNQIVETFKRKVAEYEPLPKTGIERFFRELIKDGYLDAKDEEYSDILEYYGLYVQATKMLAGTYVISDDMETAQKVFELSAAQLEMLDYSGVKTLEYIHKSDDMTRLDEHARQYLLEAGEAFLRDAQDYETLALSINGEQLLEVLTDGAISDQEAQ